MGQEDHAEIQMFPGSLPLVGHLPWVHWDALALLRRAQRRLGPVFSLDHGFGVHPVYTCGNAAFDLLRNELVDASASAEFASLITNDTLTELDGAEHRRMRGAMRKPFTVEGLRAGNVGAIIDEVIAARLRTWEGRSTVRVCVEMRELALDVIFRVVGIRQDAIRQWRRKYQDLALAMLKLPVEFPGSPAWRAKRAIAWMNERYLELVDECRQRGDRQSMLGALVHGVDEQGRGLSEVELLANLRLLGLAGHETTAAAMTWMLLHLAADPALWDRLCEEANAADGPPLDPTALARFPFAEALFREALRMYPPAWFLYRRAIEEFEYAGVTIAKGTLLVLPVITMSHDPETYDDPDRFVPDRWLGRDRGPRPIETCQFGGGPHFCMGYRLALLEGISFIVSAARWSTQHRCRPRSSNGLPTPRYLPVTHAPSRVQIRLERA